MSAPNSITPIRADLAVLGAVLDADVEVTDQVINGVWRWFQDIEIAVPLPVMDLTSDERRTLATTILIEMDDLFAGLEDLCEGKSAKSQAAVAKTPEADRVNNLWKELAGCYAELVNDEIPELPESLRASIIESMLEDLADRFGITEDAVRTRVRTDSSLRMMLRMNGLNPDDLG
jgi:hypothetical protein